MHTGVWAFFVCCIVALPLAALRDKFRHAALLALVVLIECSVLALNHFQCPLSDLARRYTSDPAPNFDIFLPRWLAQHNQSIFGLLFVLSLLIALFHYISSRRRI